MFINPNIPVKLTIPLYIFSYPIDWRTKEMGVKPPASDRSSNDRRKTDKGSIGTVKGQATTNYRL